MNPIRYSRSLGIFGVVILAAAAVSAAAPESEPAPAKTEAEILAGHSMHGDAFNEGPRQKAYLMSGMPKIQFPITAKSPEAQKFFEQGIGQLHGFWYFEAERSFRQVAALDPDCAMAYWGMAMANINNTKRAKEFIKKASELKAKADRREVLWIESLTAYHQEGGKDNKQRRREYVRALENIVQEFPHDLEAKAFLVFQIWDNSGKELPINSHQSVESLIADVLRTDPMHPIHHYRIHLWDNEKPVRALESAARCGQSSPGIAHMWHMSGHTYSKVHRYADAAWQQEASARVDHAQMIRDRLLPDQIHNYAHNNEWLIRDLSHVGRVRDAIALAKNMIELPRHPKLNVFDEKSRRGSSRYGRTRLLEVLARFDMWDDLIALGGTMYLEPTEIRAEQVKRLRALAVAHFGKGNPAQARPQIAELEELLRQEKAERIADAEQAEAKAREEKQPEDKVSKAMADAMQQHTGKIKAIEAALSELKGHEALARNDAEAARKHFDELKDLPKERRAQIELQLGDQAKAEQLIREALKAATNQVHILAHSIEILQACGQTNEASQAFDQLRALSNDLDLDVPLFQRLTPIAEARGLPADWRLRTAKPDDVGTRPALAELGPFRWQPPGAIDWSLPDADGKLVSLEQYRGKPVIAIFYLGQRCSHCMEQLNVFAPLATEFSDAGIALVAISTDSIESLRSTRQSNSETFPFPLLSDQALTVFKAYRAYDDFEQMPLHGTFLIDGAGFVRWQDISFEPFTEGKFLLAESKRLLALAEPILTLKPTKDRRATEGLRKMALSPRAQANRSKAGR